MGLHIHAPLNPAIFNLIRDNHFCAIALAPTFNKKLGSYRNNCLPLQILIFTILCTNDGTLCANVHKRSLND